MTVPWIRIHCTAVLVSYESAILFGFFSKHDVVGDCVDVQ